MPQLFLPADIIHGVDRRLGFKDYMALHSTCKGLRDDGSGYHDKQLVFNKAVDFNLNCDNPKLVRKLIQHPHVDPSAKNSQSISWACLYGHSDIVEILLSDPRVDPTLRDSEIIMFVSQDGSDCPDLIRLLLNDRRIDPSVNDNALLNWACIHGFVDIVDILLSDARVDPSESYHHNFVFQACKHGHVDVLKRLLLDHRIEPDADESIGLVEATHCINHIADPSFYKHGHAEIVSILLADGRSDPNAHDRAPLANTIYYRNWNIMKDIISDPRTRLDMDIFWDICIAGGCSIIQLLLLNQKEYASAFDHEAMNRSGIKKITAHDVVKQLLSDPRLSSGSQPLSVLGVDPSANDNLAIQKACGNEVQDEDVVKLLLADSRVDPSANNNAAFFLACQKNYVSTVKLLIKDPRVDPSTDNNSAFLLACKNCYDGLVKVLIADPRVDPSVNNNAVLLSVCESYCSENYKILKLLLSDPRVDPTIDNNLVLRRAYEKNNTTILKILLSDPRVDPTVIKYCQPIHQPMLMNPTTLFQLACKSGLVDVVRCLLQDSDLLIDPSADDNHALRIATEVGYTEITELLKSDQRVVSRLQLESL